jgi:DNA-binding HxlR family transcriptional regulator
VGNELQGKVTDITPEQAAITVEQVLEVFSGRWKLLILFHLFDGKVQRFSELERLIPGVSQKMLTQQLRQLEGHGIVHRTVHPEVPPKVEYRLTDLGQSLCPSLDALVKWSRLRDTTMNPPDARPAGRLSFKS